MTFTVEIQDPQDVMESNHVVHFYLDEAELDQLIFDLETLKTTTRFSDIILASESWGLGDLDEKPLRSDSVITHMLKITKVENTK